MAILKEGGRQPLKDETKEAIAQRKHQALDELRSTFSEIGLDEKGESTRFSTRNEKYVALKVREMYEIASSVNEPLVTTCDIANIG